MTAPDVNADVRARFEDRWPDAKEWRHPQEDRYILIDYQLRWQAYRAAHADRDAEVRELVEADREYDTARSRYSAAFRDGPNGDLNEQRLAQKHLNDAKARRAAALAKFHPTHQEKP